MSELDAERIAKRLGLTDAAICQLRAHGYLQRLAVTAHELDARIYRAHLAYLKRDAQPPSTRTRPGHAGELHHAPGLDQSSSPRPTSERRGTAQGEEASETTAAHVQGTSLEFILGSEPSSVLTASNR